MTEKIAALIDKLAEGCARHERVLLSLGMAVVAVFMLLRVFALSADFPVNINSRFVRDSVLYTDEGWYSSNAQALYRTGSWYQPGDMNFLINIPVQQTLQAVTFFFTGPGIVGVRLTSVLCFWISTLATALVLLRFERPWVALVAAILMSSNFFGFAYSRTGLSETVFMMFVMLAALATVHSNRAGWQGHALAGAVGALMALAVLTKTSAAVAGPAILGGLMLVNRDKPATMWAKVGWMMLGGILLMALHRVLLVAPFRDDYDYFHTINVGMNFSFNIYDGTMTALEMGKRMMHMDTVMYPFFQVAVWGLLLILPALRRRPMVWLAMGFVVMYVGAFAFYGNVQPRYWAALVPAFAMVVALAMAALYEDRRRHWLFGLLFLAMMGQTTGATLKNTALVASHFARLQYSVATATENMKDLMEQSGLPGKVLLGHFACNFALYQDFYPVNDLYAPSTLEWRIETYRPRFLVTEGPVEPAPKHFLEHLDSNPAERLARFAILSDHFEMEELARYPMLERYKDYDVYFYRLHPKPHLGWPDVGEAGSDE